MNKQETKKSKYNNNTNTLVAVEEKIINITKKSFLCATGIYCQTVIESMTSNLNELKLIVCDLHLTLEIQCTKSVVFRTMICFKILFRFQ